MCRHMQRVRWQRDRRLTPSRNCEKRRRPVRTCIYTTLKPVHNSFGEVNRTDTTCDSFHPAFNTQVTEGKKIQQRFYILIWSVNCSWIWRMKLSLLAGLFETWTDSLWCLSPFNLLKSAYLRDYIRFFACFCRLSI